MTDNKPLIKVLINEAILKMDMVNGLAKGNECVADNTLVAITIMNNILSAIDKPEKDIN